MNAHIVRIVLIDADIGNLADFDAIVSNVGADIEARHRTLEHEMPSAKAPMST
jgi:hypothetical protein